MAKVLINPSAGPSRQIVGERSVRSREVLDPKVAEKIEARETRAGVRAANKKRRQKGVDGGVPKPIDNKSKRVFVGIEPGNLVTVRGYRDIKWVVISEPSAKFQKRGTGEIVEVKSHTRRVGKAVVSVTLMGPDGVQVEVPIGWCKPLHL